MKASWFAAALLLLTALPLARVFWPESPVLATAGRAATADPVIAAAGDIACSPNDPRYHGGTGIPDACRMRYTSDLLMEGDLTAVLVLGDSQYEDEASINFNASYDPTWGRMKAITRPAPGNHEYAIAGASDYYNYFGAAAGDPSRGYYSYEIGSWHIVALNGADCSVVACDAGSAQEQWLRADLAAHPTACTLAYWHQPRFSSGLHGSDPIYAAFWRTLYTYHVDIVLNGHDHDYERFAPQDPDGTADPVNGIREFVVGTGGRTHYRFGVIERNSEVRDADTFGVLKLTLHPNSYDWEFVPEAGRTFTDSGSEFCH